MADRFDRFSERAHRVLTLAREEAQRLNHHYIGTEHLLLGLIREGEGVAAKVLANLGVDLVKLRADIEAVVPRGDRYVLGEIGLTPRSKKVIELAVDEARRLNHGYIGTEHLLLGLVREGEGIAAGVLKASGVNLERVRAETVRVLQQSQTRSSQVSLKASATTAPGPSARFDKFSEQARRALSLAQEEAQRFNHNYIGTEHLLLGVTRDAACNAAKVLAGLGVGPTDVRAAVETAVPKGDRAILGEIGLTPRARKVIELGVGEARRLRHNYIGTEHLLLGMLLEGEGIAAGVLVSLAVNLERVQAAADTMSRENSSVTPQPRLSATGRRTSLRESLDAASLIVRHISELASLEGRDELVARLRQMELALQEEISRLETLPDIEDGLQQ